MKSAPVVFLIAANPKAMTSPEAIMAEERLAFVAITRSPNGFIRLKTTADGHDNSQGDGDGEEPTIDEVLFGVGVDGRRRPPASSDGTAAAARRRAHRRLRPPP